MKVCKSLGIHSNFNEIERIDEGECKRAKLRILFLNENKLKTLPDALFIGSPNLEMAFIDRNEITHIGNAFNNYNKQILSLSDNPVEDLNLFKFAALDNLDSLFLNGMKFTFQPDTPSHFPYKSKLTTIVEQQWIV